MENIPHIFILLYKHVRSLGNGKIDSERLFLSSYRYNRYEYNFASYCAVRRFVQHREVH